jgi:hypothetical protein
MPDKITTKIVQDGMEISWEHQRDAPLSVEDAAKLSLEGAEALQKFKEKDPRTQPKLRAEDKAKKDAEKAMKFRFEGVLLALFLFWLAMAASSADCRGAASTGLSRSPAASGVNYGSRTGGCN